MNQLEQLVLECQAMRKLVDEHLGQYLKNHQPLLHGLFESISYSLDSGGKRIRPIFALIVGDLFAVPRKNLMPLACALEMIHTASLIMDDLPHMDNSKVRRGKPANHMVFGQDVATLASIGLLALAYEVVMQDNGFPDARKAEVVRKLAGAIGINGMVGGQFVDLKFLNESVTFPVLEFIHVHKTASLFSAAGETAAIAGDASDPEIRAIRSYAQNLGFAFQILDDLLDSTGSAGEVGKPLRHDRANFISLFGIEKSKELAGRFTQNAVLALSIFGERSEKLVALTSMLLKRVT